MSAHVLLNLLNSLRKRDKMRGVLSILSLFLNEFNKFNNRRARMLDSINHIALKYPMHNKFSNCFVWVSSSTSDQEFHLLP